MMKCTEYDAGVVIAIAMRKIAKSGPDLVVVSDEGEIAPFHQAIAMGVEVSEIQTLFVRDDGWLLGVPRQFEDAPDYWANLWVAAFHTSGRIEPLYEKIEIS